MRRSVKALITLAALAAVGVARIPLESAVTADFQRRHILPPPIDVGLRESLTQNSFAAALGGARSVVASIENLRAFTAWENREWGKVENSYNLITQLQPRVPSYWELGSWHLAYNAAGYYRYDWDGPRTPLSPAALERIRLDLWADYVRKGQEMLDDGIRQNPDSWRLAELAGMLWADPLKLPDPAKAAHYYTMAAAIPGAPSRVRRFAAYNLALVPGREKEALDALLALYHESPQNHLPTLLGTLLDLQLRFDTPAAGRIPLTGLGSTPDSQLENLRNFAAFRASRNAPVSPAFRDLIAQLESSPDLPIHPPRPSTP